MSSMPFIITQAKPKPSPPGEPVTHVHIWQINSHNVGVCSLCGEVKQFPWDGRGPTTVLKKGNPSINQVSEQEEHMTISNMEKHQRYEEHKEEILADLRSIGRPATRKKWKIPSGTMGLLEERWLTPQERQALTSRSRTSSKSPARRQAVVTTPTNNHLPSFPEFSNEWPESVQVKWFEVYEQLISPNFPLPPSSP